MRGEKYILESHLVPFFGKSRISQITNLQIELYKAKKLDSGLSSKTGNNHLTVLAKCLRIAEEWLELEKLPKIKRLKVPPQKFDFLTFEESDLLLRHADGIWYEMILTALRTGLRFGELRALDWSDINWATKLLTVRHSLCRYRNIKQTPKSNKERHVPLADDVCEALGKRRAEKGFVFGDGEGRPFDKKRLYRELKMICKKTGLRVIAWHALRHTFASHLAMAAAPMKAIQELMGHADITTTLRYAHLSSSTLKEVIDLLPTKKSMINFGQQAVNTYTNLTKIEQLGAYDKAIFLAKNKTKTAPGGHCSVLSG